MTLVLVVLTGASLLWVLREVNPAAAAESLKAREPLYGELRFENTESEGKGINVGREWDYRSHITKAAPGQEPPTARWDFPSVPGSLADREGGVQFEYTFDVYRTTKGEKEGADVTCAVRLFTWRYQRGNDLAFKRFRDGPDDALQKEFGLSADEVPKRGPERDSFLAEKFGYYEIEGQPVTDYHTQNFTVPVGLFRNVRTADPDLEQQLKDRGQGRVDLQVRVTCESPTQYVGMARYDLYARLDDPRSEWEKTRFAWNFFKGAFGLWLKLALVIALAVVLSTYLSGVITLLVVAVLFFGGLNLDFINSVALGTNYGGGPTEAALRILRRELSGASVQESTATTEQIINQSDMLFRGFLRVTLRMIPDVERFTFTDKVAEGFNISGGEVGRNLLLLLAYLLPWFMLAFYLMRWREVANPN
jgi:hypothetical protein